jgi:DNA-binding transcriptional ArsR family regulator
VSELPADLLLHPVRLRIVQAMVGRPMTATDVKNLLGDVAQATLYRHLKQLHEGGLLEIIDERQVRGAVERTYRVVTEAVSLGADDLAGVDADDHFRYFATFVGTLLSDYASYLRTGRIDLAADRVGFRQVPLWLSDDELDDLVEELRFALESRIDHLPGSGRRRRLISSVVMPDDRSNPPEKSPTRAHS